MARGPDLPAAGRPAGRLTLRTIADPAALAGWTTVLELGVVEGEAVDRVELVVADGALDAELRAAREPVTVWEASPDALRAVTFGRRPLADATEAGDVRISGDVRVLRRLLAALRVPDPAAAPSR